MIRFIFGMLHEEKYGSIQKYVDLINNFPQMPVPVPPVMSKTILYPTYNTISKGFDDMPHKKIVKQDKIQYETELYITFIRQNFAKDEHKKGQTLKITQRGHPHKHNKRFCKDGVTILGRDNKLKDLDISFHKSDKFMGKHQLKISFEAGCFWASDISKQYPSYVQITHDQPIRL